MAFGGSGFGSNTGGGFGFGNNNNTSTTSGASLFGGNTATSGGFGSGFGANNITTNNSPFGAAKPGFGATPAAGNSLFGGGANTTGGFGGSGFGTSNASAGASTGFGAASNTTSLFGAKPATGGFGSTNNSTSLFGSNAASGFGATNNTTQANPFGGAANTTTSTFGAPAATTNSFGGASGFGGGFGASTTNNTTMGTAATPFTATTEKDPGSSNTSSAYQSITMQSPYQQKSFEELRLEDYAQNRRLPQNNSFGSGSTFSGFGGNNTNTTQARPGLFGAAANTNSFGSNTASTGFGASTTGFGANNTTGTSLFGAAKPATTGLFGSTPAATSTTGFGGSSTTGGLFGSNNTTANTSTTGFGGFGGNNNASTTNSLFGANNNQNKGFSGFGGSNPAPASTGFGGFNNNNNNNNTATTTQGGGLFGASTNTGGFGASTGGGLFGAAKSPTPGLFGAAANTTAPSGGLFGAASNTQPAAGFGASTGTGLFGSNQNANTTGGLFGAKSTTPAAGGLFGNTPAPATGTGLFGAANNNQTSLFGGNNQNNTGGLFGNNQPKPTTSLFGSANNAGNTSLFGNSTSTGGGLFNNTQNQSGGLFGNSTASAGNSLFNSQGPQQNQLTASITGDPYGNAQLFASLAGPSPPVGPLATPLSGAKPAPKARASLLASVRGSSPMLGASTSLTPRARTGYGFSYSNYNSPAANTPVLTPGATSLLRPSGSLGSAFGSRLSKSYSTSNLRSELGDGPSLIRTPAPGQGSLLLGNGSLGSGNIRRLKIDRSLRTDLFSDTPKKQIEAKESEKEPDLRKRVSFDKSAEKDVDSTPKPSAANALVVRDDDAPEMSQVNGSKSLGTVHEEGQSPRRLVEAGEYYTEPSLKQIKNMSRGQLSSLKSFTVGRQGVGKVEFGRNCEIDLSNVPLDDICGKIVQLKARSATVYEDDSDKPPVGKGLNLPSTIHLEQSWPRAARHSNGQSKSTPQAVDKHKARLQRVSGTKFVSYNDNTGVWTFTVEHFTTYELDDDEESSMQVDEAAAVSPSAEYTQRSFGSEPSLDSPDLGEQDDTFSFKLTKRPQQNSLSLPGGFEDSMAITYDHDETSADEMQEDEFTQDGGLGDAAIADPFVDTAEAVQPQYTDDEEDVEQEVPGSFQDGLKSILKPSTFDEPLFGAETLADMPWEEQLQRTLSPKKRDRQALRDAQHLRTGAPEPDTLLKKSLLTRSQLGQSYLTTKGPKNSTKDSPRPSAAFTTSMDIMRSLWADDKQALQKVKPSVQPSQRDGNADTSFHQSFKPTFTCHNTLVFAGQGNTTQQHGDITIPLKPIVGDQRDIKFYRARNNSDIDAPALKIQQNTDSTIIEAADIEMEDDEDEEGPEMPSAITSRKVEFAKLARNTPDTPASSAYEKLIWKLCSVLFDDIKVTAGDLIRNMDESTIDEMHSQIRRDSFLSMWTDMIRPSVEKQVQAAKTSEETALLHLTMGSVFEAAQTLQQARNPKLALLVAQLPGSDANGGIMKEQIRIWQERKDWSEFSDGQRALYSILAQSTCLVSGLRGAPEDRCEEFSISRKYGLTWQQSLALKVRYSGIDGLPQAIVAYLDDIRDNIDPVKPVPWHGHADQNQDVTLSLLSIIADKADAAAILDPTITTGDAFHNRLSWQLASLLGARGVLQASDDQMDSLTVDLATEQEAAGRFLDALWTLLHLNDNASRHTALKSVLERSCAQIPDPLEGKRGVFETITEDLCIPATMVWSAKAQGTVDNPVLRCRRLLLANTHGSLQEAHDVLCQTVGPTAVIEENYDDIRALLKQFIDIGSVKFDGWSTGGQIYNDLSQLLQLRAHKSHGRDAEALLKKLDRGLEAQKEHGDGGVSLEMRVARLEISKIVHEGVKQLDDVPKWYDKLEQRSARTTTGIRMLEQYMRALTEVH